MKHRSDENLWREHCHANFYFKFLRIIHQMAVVLQVRFRIVLLSQEYATQDNYLLLKENFSEFSCAEFFSTEDKYFLPFEEPRIWVVTVHVYVFPCKVTEWLTVLLLWIRINEPQTVKTANIE